MESSGLLQTRVHILALLLSFGAAACGSPVVESNDPRLSQSGPGVFLNGVPFTGKIRTEIPAADEVHFTSYKNGLEDGTSTVETSSGKLLASRAYRMGIKHGIHRTWYASGVQKSYAKFQFGRYTGQVWQWHDNNVPAQFDLYNERGEIQASKVWRRTGQIYMNHTFQNGAAIGMPGSKVCDPVGTQVSQ